MSFLVKNLPEKQFLLLGQKIFKIFEKIEKKKFAVDVFFVGTSRMKKLNGLHRKKFKDTDILSFPLEIEKEGRIFLGDLVLSKHQLLKQGQKDPLKKVFTKLFIHGLYHLRGYTHEKTKDYLEMKKKEENLLKKVL